MLQLLEMSSITTPDQTILNVCTRYNVVRAPVLDCSFLIFSFYFDWVCRRLHG